MPRLLHGDTVSLEAFHAAAAEVANLSAEVPLAFAASVSAEVQDFDFLFPKLQENAKNLLPEARATRDALVALGRTMRDTDEAPSGDSRIPAAYTYFGQFVDHDVTLETTSATADELVAEDLVPLPLDEIRGSIHNLRTATLDLDSVYGPPAARDGEKLALGAVTALGGSAKPLLRPPGKGDANDVPREPRSSDPKTDRAALIGDPRNDENLVIAQLQLAFLRAHNALVDRGYSFDDARRTLRQHYQHVVVHDFLPRVCDPKVVRRVLREGNKLYHPFVEPFFLPLEFAVAAYRFGHSLIRSTYDFNLNFNISGEEGTVPASLGLLFTFTALSGQLGFPGQESDTLPENWIIEWENFVETPGRTPNRARRIDPKLVEPLFELPDIQGRPEAGDKARLAVRNLLRGYLLRIPTGQAVARAVRKRWGTPVLSKRQLLRGAASDEQREVLSDSSLLERTPLWYYLLAEASVLAKGRHLGPVGSFVVAEVLVGLARRSESSILRLERWKPTLPSRRRRFELADLLRLAGVLEADGREYPSNGKKAGKGGTGKSARKGKG